ncbi:non-ribosomal peptide synthetase/MFS transporter [Planomonospora sp. ID91781]|uniref:non-ribosomal peptide synthetase/MFS transporter n=1 Tax=Planomonospora sp. ID91781 TaxID=2738135 RepID=UPI0018C4243D|nr:non-ribosomal peptide synthetase/MFS transporter [Planomonospora sp. ID91781]
MTEVTQDRIAELVRSRFAAARAAAEAPGAAADAPGAAGIPALSAADMPLSPAQERLWFLAQLEPDTPAYNVPLALRLSGPVDVAALTAAVAELAERHWILRGVVDGTRVRPAGGVPVPVVDVEPAELERELAEHAWRPFRLDAEPPMRAALFRAGGDEYVLALILHHIATDAWSERLLLQDLAALYAARLGLAPQPEPPALQYADVAAWEAGRSEDGCAEDDLDWWTRRLAGLPPVLDLPVARPRPDVPTWEGAAVAFEVPADLAAKVRAVAGTTPFMVFLAGLQTLLSRLSGGDDIAVGVPDAGRHHPDTEGVVGCFINTLVIRTDTSGDPTGAELLARARTAALDAFAQARTPFERIVERLQPERNLSVTPLFQVMLNVYDTGAPVSLPGVEVRPEPLPVPTAKFDLNLTVGDDGERFSGELRYRTDLFEETVVRRLVDWYLALLDGMLTDPDAPVLLPAGPDLHGPAGAPPADAPLHALVERAAEAFPDVVAVVSPGRAPLGYAELERRANQVAHWLLERGVRPQEPVGVLMERRPELAVALLGILKAGAAYLPLDPVYPARRTEAVLAAAGARIVLTEAEVADAADRPAHRPDVAVPPDHLAYVIYTSGSTGEPKGVAVEHRQITHYLGAVNGRLPEGAGSFALVSTAAADLGLTNVLCALTSGATLHLVDHETATDPAAYAAHLAAHPVDVVKMVPSQLELLGVDALPRKLLILAGEAVPRDLVERVRAARPSLDVQIHYGPTETTVSALACDGAETASGAVPLGRPLPGVRCRVVDSAGRPLPHGVPGELWIGGPGVARGYLGRPDLTAQRFTDGWYRTGDRVRVNPAGLVEFLGRIDDQVKVRGFRVELGEVTAALRALPQVAEAFVQPVGTGAQRRLAAWVTPSREGAVDVAAIRAALRERLPDYMVPSAIGVLEALPLTPNGKVDRAALPVPEAGPVARVPLGTPQEHLVAEVWAEVLDLPQVWADDDFFALGGHSFAATRVVGRLRERLGAPVAVRLLFEHPVLADLAAALPRPAAAPAVRRARADGPVPLSGVQARLWFLAQLEPESTAYNVPLALRLRGPLRAEALLGAVRDLAERHHVLRSVIDDSGAEPVLVVRPAEDVPVSTAEIGPAEVEDAVAAHLATPFALDREPPMRAVLLAVGETEHVLSLTFHHIATDAWTRGLLLSELAALYAARLGLRPPPEPPPAQYAEVAPVPDLAELDWWAERLRGLPPVLDLPADRPRPAVADPGGASVDLELPAELSERVRAVAAAYRATPFIVLLAALQALLARLSAGTDIAVGVPVAGRDHPDTEGVVGCFLNTVVVRTDVGGDPTGRELLARVRESSLGAFAHASAPFDRVVDRLRPERNLSATPLFQVMLNYVPGTGRPELPGLEAAGIEPPERTAKFDLNWYVVDDGPGRPLRGGLGYRTDLFGEATAARFTRWYLALLDGMLADLDAPVGAQPLEPVTGPILAGELLPEAGAGQVPPGGPLAEAVTDRVPVGDLPVEAAAGRVPAGDPSPVAADVPVHRLIERWVDASPDAPAVVGADRSLTYAELESEANRIAHWLLEGGTGADEPVGVLLEPGAGLACALFGIQKSGGGYLPMDPAYPAARIAAMLDAAGVRAVITTAEFAGLIGPDRRVLALDRLPSLPRTRPETGVRPEHLHHVIFTSGSTGTPKAVAVEHRSVTGYLNGMLPRIGVPGGSYAVVSTPAADFGLTCVFGALTTGGTVHLVPRETAMDPEAFAGYLSAHRVDVVKCVPSHLELLASGGDLAAVLPEKLLILAGEACPWDLVERARAARPGLRIQSHYGHTESTMICLVCETEEVEAEHRTGIVPLGRPLPGVYGHLVDAELRPVPVGVPGELVVGGPGVTRGYIGLPELTAERFVPDPLTGRGRCYRSGDLLRVTADGRVEFRGRVDDQVKVRGYRVELGEVVAALRALPQIAEAVVLPVGEGKARQLAAWVTPSAGSAGGTREDAGSTGGARGNTGSTGNAGNAGSTVDTAAVRSALRDRLPDYMVPTQFVVLDRLPLNPNGKIDRAALPEPQPETAEFVPPSTAAEELVARVWAQVLGVPEVGANDDFFALGGDSFAAVRAVKEIGGGLRVIDLFTRPTVAELAAFLGDKDGGGLLHRLSGGRTSEFTLVCVPYGGGSAAVYQPLAWALGEGVEVLAAELPGHDPARPDEAPLPLEELVEILAAEATGTASGPIAVYGHCVGSALAVALARRLEADGVPVLGVITGGSFPAAQQLPGLTRRFFRGDRWVSDRMFRDALRATGGLQDDMDEAAVRAAVRAMRHDATEAREWFGRELEAGGAPLRAPILCVVGERDRATELHEERYAEWAVFAPRVEPAVLPRAGHYFLRHQAEPLAALVVEHLRRWASGKLPDPVRPPERTGLRPFYTVAGGQFVSAVGTALSSFALGVWAYQLSGRILDLALVVMLSQIPAVILTPLGGALADRVDRRRVMLACDAVSGLATAALVLLLVTGRLELWSVCAIVGVTSMVTAFQQPAYLAAVAQLVPKPYLPQANALANLGFGVGNVVAPLAGGALIGVFGLSAVVAIDVVSFGVGVVTLLAVRFPDRLFHRQEETFGAALTGGWRFLNRRRPLLVMAFYFAVVNFCTALMWVLITPVVLAIGSPAALGTVTAVGGLGAAVGTGVVLIWGGTRRRATGMVGFVVGSGVGVVLMGAWPAVWLIAAGLFLRLACMSIGNAHWLSIIQVKVGPELQGRVLAVNVMLATAMQPLGFLAAGPLADWAQRHTSGPGRGAAAVLLVSGVFLVVWGLLGLRYRKLHHLEDLVPDAAPPPEAAADLDAIQAEVLGR